MKFYTVYLPNGQIERTGTCADFDFFNNVKEGELFIEEMSDPSNQYVDNGMIVNKPQAPGQYYIFDYDLKQWVFDENQAINNSLQKRDLLLKDGPDRISPIWYDSMTQDEKTAWADYRQALLDITSQPNYPHDIIWPIKPGTGE